MVDYLKLYIILPIKKHSLKLILFHSKDISQLYLLFINLYLILSYFYE